MLLLIRIKMHCYKKYTMNIKKFVSHCIRLNLMLLGRIGIFKFYPSSKKLIFKVRDNIIRYTVLLGDINYKSLWLITYTCI